MPIISVNGRKIVESGSVVLSPKQDSVEIRISDLMFVLLFEKQEGAESPHVEMEMSGDKGLKLRLINWENQLGSGFSARVGTFEDQELHITVSSDIIGSPEKYSRQIAYTFTVQAPS
jgi:hypothetical protein